MKSYCLVYLAFLLTFCGHRVQAEVAFNPDTVAFWADSIFEKALREKRFSGAVISVIQDGEIILSKGYGYADYEKKSAIDPETTVFRIGSATKTFTATAIAQLMERGLIGSLDDPANLYLKRDRLPIVDGRDITLRDLITHSAGFANRTFHIATAEDIPLPLTASEIQAQRPAIVREPGGRAVYSNYGTALLGTVVEDITGQRIDGYFRDHIFTPLGMTRSTLSLSTRPPDGLAQPHAFFPNGEAQALPYWAIHPFFAPAGAVAATAVDMAHYMAAHIDAGANGPSPLAIGPDLFALMHGRIAGNHPAVQGFGMIFLSMDWAGKRGFGHGGDWPGFHSIMWMLPDSNIGIFVSLMAEAPRVPITEALFGSPRLTPDPDAAVLPPMTNIGVLSAFLGHFLGADRPPAGFEGAPIDLDALVGQYRHEYRAYGGMEEFLDLLNGGQAVIAVERSGDDSIRINGRGPYEQIGPGLFWNPAHESAIDGGVLDSPLWAFAWDGREKRYFATPRLSIDPFVKVSALASPTFYSGLLPVVAPLVISGLVAVFWAVRTRSERLARGAMVGLALLLLSLPMILMLDWGGKSFLNDFMIGDKGRFIAAAGASNGFAVLTLLALTLAVCAWAAYCRDGGHRNGIRQILKDIHLSIVALAALGFSVILLFFNFLGFNIN